ncbi:MAG: hydrogenase maturation nickel metallochaperone HypA [Alphaproteobacteria bacterium]
MHELALAQSLVTHIAEVAQRENLARIDRVMVCVGALSGIDAASLSFCFPVAARDTPAGHARLIVREELPSGQCLNCERLSADISPSDPRCPACGSEEILLQGGDTLRLESLEIDDV